MAKGQQGDFKVRLFGKFPDIPKSIRNVKRQMEAKLEVAAKFLLARVKEATPVGATKAMKKSWITERKEGEVRLVNPTMYTAATELGRRAAPVSQEGRKLLEAWAVKKLGVSVKEAKSVAFLIARKKKLKPTKGQFFVKETLEENRKRINDFLFRSFEAITSDMESQRLKPPRTP